MPAVASLPPTQVVVVWDMPFASAARGGSAGLVRYCRESTTRKAFEEGIQAIRRFRSLSEDFATASAPSRSLLNPLAPMDDLRQFASTRGIDLDALVKASSLYFNSSEIHRRTVPLANEELESFFEDDQLAFDR